MEGSPEIHGFDARQFEVGENNIVFNGAFFQPPFLTHAGKTRTHSFFCVYRTNPSVPEWFDSKIRIARVREKDHRLVPDPETDRLLVDHGEDPRVLPLTERHVLVTYTDVTDTTNTRAVIRGDLFVADYERHAFHAIKSFTFDLNASRQKKQKNWNFYVDPYTQHVMLIYRLMPFEVYDLGHVHRLMYAAPDFYEKEVNRLECMLRTTLVQRQFWKHPHSDMLLVRGGSNPVYVRDGVFYLFVHSGTYKMFCLVMTKPTHTQPWRIAKVGSRPIVYHEKDRTHQVHFPGGAVYDPVADVFHVCLGIDDHKLGYVTLDKAWVDQHLVDVQ